MDYQGILTRKPTTVTPTTTIGGNPKPMAKHPHSAPKTMACPVFAAVMPRIIPQNAASVVCAENVRYSNGL